MTPPEIKAARKALGLSTAGMAEWLGLELPNGERRIRRWESGQEEIWAPAARALELATERRQCSVCKAIVAASPEGMCCHCRELPWALVQRQI